MRGTFKWVLCFSPDTAGCLQGDKRAVWLKVGNVSDPQKQQEISAAYKKHIQFPGISAKLI